MKTLKLAALTCALLALLGVLPIWVMNEIEKRRFVIGCAGDPTADTDLSLYRARVAHCRSAWEVRP